MSWMLPCIWILVVAFCEGNDGLRSSLESLRRSSDGLQHSSDSLRRSPDGLRRSSDGLRRSSQAIACPDGFLNIEHSCFKLVTDSKTWYEANTYCNHDVISGHLAVVENSNVYAGLTSLVKKNNIGVVWIGARDVYYRRFQWVNGHSCCPNWWIPGEPSGNGRCLQFWNHNGLVGLDDHACSTKRPFFCETNGCPLTVVTNCQKYNCVKATHKSVCIECTVGFRPVENGSICFDFGTPLHIKCLPPYTCVSIFTLAQTWADAENICKARNGHLYVPVIPDEDYRLRTYLEDLINSDTMFWIGGHLLGNSQTQWIDNVTVSMERWSNTGKPESLNTEMCIAMDPVDKYQLRALPCNTRLNFICHEQRPYNILQVG